MYSPARGYYLQLSERTSLPSLLPVSPLGPGLLDTGTLPLFLCTEW